MMPKLPEPDVLHEVADSSCPSCLTLVRFSSPIALGYSTETVRAIQEEAYRAGMAAELERCAKVLDALGCDHCSSALRFSRKQSEGK